MEALPFIVLIFAGVVFYAAIPLGYLIAIYFIGKEIGAKFGSKFNYAFLLVMILGPVVWASIGYFTFRTSCYDSEGIKIYRTVSDVKGFIVVKPSAINRKIYTSNAPYKLLENHTYQCLVKETFDNRFDKLSQSIETMNEKGSFSGFSLTDQREKEFCKQRIEYAFKITQPKIFSLLTSPFFKTSDIVIFNKSSGEILAKVREYLFGGSFLSVYRNALDGGKSNEYTACGFLSKKPHKWRPQKFKEYTRKESELLISTLIPSKLTQEQKTKSDQ